MAAIDAFLKSTVERKASDLHLAVGVSAMLRIDGELVSLDEKVLTQKDVETLVYGMITSAAKQRFTTERELDFGYSVVGVGRFRVNIHFEKGNIGLVARAIPSEIPSMEALGMPSVLFDLAREEQGLVLVTGPTGQGKSTALAAMVELRNTERANNIVTLEVPIEFVFTPKKSIVKQRELGVDMLSFAEGLKHVLRQDPNVIMVGEMRDLETIAAALTVAETGHLVLATLHTYSAAQTIDRIIDVFPPHQQEQVRMQVSMVLKGVISQRLLPKKDGGRVAAREIMLTTPAVATLIRDNKVSQLNTAMQTGRAGGMQTMDADLARLVSEGVVEAAVAKRYLSDPDVIK